MNNRISINYDIAILWGDIFSIIAEQEIYILLSFNPNISNFVFVKFNILRLRRMHTIVDGIIEGIEYNYFLPVIYIELELD